MFPDGVYAFGPFTLDTTSHGLRRDQQDVPIADAQVRLLWVFVRRRGELLTKEDLYVAGWGTSVVEENTLSKTLWRLRRTLDAREPYAYIATVKGRGYRFIAEASRLTTRRTDAEIAALIGAEGALVTGRAALEALSLEDAMRARLVFSEGVARRPDEPAHHVGLATAGILTYEASTSQAEPDLEALRLATVHATEACRLNDRHAEAFGLLGLILGRTGDLPGAVGALRRACSLEPENWLHRIRLAWVLWGEPRLEAVGRTLSIIESPFAHLLAAMVATARNQPAIAEREVDLGLAARRGESPTRYVTVGLDLLKGLLAFARGDDDTATAAWEREMSHLSSGHIYARWFAALASYAMGARHYAADDLGAAGPCFTRAVALAPRLAMAHAGLAMVTGHPLQLPAQTGSDAPTRADRTFAFDSVVTRAALLQCGGDIDGAARLVEQPLAHAPPGDTGWMIPVDPLLRVWQTREAWRTVLGQLRSRAR